MIEHVLFVKQAYNRTIHGIQELHKFTLTNDKWQCLQKISELLFEFARLTPVLSRESYPIMNLVIISYNRLLGALENYMEAWNTVSKQCTIEQK